MAAKTEIIPAHEIERMILLVRGEKVILDRDLAELYEVTTAALNRQVTRNQGRFPEDFMFVLTPQEVRSLKERFGEIGWGGARYQHRVFTEQGVAMLSGVLKSKRAVQVNIEIMRAFVRLRRILIAHKELATKLGELEKKYDRQFAIVFDAIRQLMDPPVHSPKRIGFTNDK